MTERCLSSIKPCPGGTTAPSPGIYPWVSAAYPAPPPRVETLGSLPLPLRGKIQDTPKVPCCDASARPGGGKPLPYIKKELKLTHMGDGGEGPGEAGFLP